MLAVIFAALFYTAYASRHSRVEVHSNSLRLVGDFWGRTIPLSRLDLSAARVVDLDNAPELRPRRRTFGTGLPGYASGWFRLHNGEKALLYLSNRHRVVYLPTSAGYALLLSVDDPQSLIDALQQKTS